MTQRNEGLTFCHLRPEHIDQLAELEVQCFSDPWSERALELYLADGTAFVALDPAGCVTAYGGMLPGADEGEIVNLATRPNARRQGLGGAVLDALLADADRRGLIRLALEVRISNSGAIALYRSRSFAVAGIRRRFYTAPAEDAYTMVRHTATADFQKETI